MSKRFTGAFVRVVLIVFCAALVVEPAVAGARSYGVVVVHDITHGKTRRLSRIRPVPPANGLQRIVPLRPTHPVRPRRVKLDPLLQESAPGVSQATVGAGFLGVGVGLDGITGDAYIPPDTNGSAGPTQYVQWVNVSFAVFNKFTGAVEYGPTLGSTLWSSLGGACANNNSGDIIAQFDKQAGRWVMMQPVFTRPYDICVAVSATPDATGAYYAYQFAVPSNSNFPDYPKLAVWSDGYYMSFNSFHGNTYEGPTACVLDRNAMLNGQSATMSCTSPLGSSYSPLLPADLDGDVPGLSTTTSAPPSEADYYLNFGTNALDVWQFSSDHSTFSLLTTIAVPSFSEACGGGACIPQSGTNEQLDSLGDRMMYRLAYRNVGTTGAPDEVLVANQSVDTGTGQVGIRWYELENTGSGFHATPNEGTFAPSDGNYRWMGSIAMDSAKDIAVGYSVSGNSINPGIAFTVNDPSLGDPAGQMEAETTILSGAGSQTSANRWGDYSGMTVDPTDDCTFWYTNEYLQSTGDFNWSTEITPIRLPSCSTLELDAEPAGQSVNAGSSTNYTLAVTPSSGSGATTFTVTGLPSGAGYTVGSISGKGSTTLAINTASTTPAGTYVLDIAATNGVTDASSVVLTVNSATTLVTVSSVTLNPNSVAGGNSSSGTVTLSAAAPSGGVVVNLSSSDPGVATAPASVTVAAGALSAAFAVTTSSVTTATDVLITGSYNGSSASATLAVNPATSSGSFSIVASPSSVSVLPRQSANYTVTITSVSGFNGSVSLSVSGEPGRTSTGFSVNPVTVSSGSSAQSILTVATSRKTPPGTYTLTLTGASGSLSQSTTVAFVVR